MESDIVDDLSDDLIRDVFTYLSTNKYPEASSSSRKRVIRKKALKFFISTSGELMYKQKLKGKEPTFLRYVQSPEERRLILLACHVHPTSGHMGRTRTLHRIKERVMWHGMVKDCTEMIRTCDICQRMNRKLTCGMPELHPIPVKSPWYMIGIDFIGPISPPGEDGSQYILTISDYFTKWVEAIPTPDKTATTVANCLFKIFMRMGLPRVMLSDNGSEFCNKLNDKLAEILGVKRRLTTPYHPQANGLQNPILQKTKTFDVQRNLDFVQCLNIKDNHWITVSAASSIPDTINVYDSLNGTLTEPLKQIIADLMHSAGKQITVQYVSVQYQKGSQDCGLFAIAFACEICFGKDPSSVTFVQSTMRQHLIEGLEQGNILPFPSAVRRQRSQMIVQDFSGAGIQVVFAAMTKKNRDMLERSGFFKKFGEEWLFPTIKDAVEFAKVVLGAPIGEVAFCSSLIASKRAAASILLSSLVKLGSCDPQIALILLRMCGEFTKLVHVARSTPPSLALDELHTFDEQVRCTFTECQAIDTTDSSWMQAQLSLSRGGLGLRSLAHHSNAAFIASISTAGLASPSDNFLADAVNSYNRCVPPESAIDINSLTSSPCRQHTLSAALENIQFNSLLSQSSVADKARLLSVSSPHASAWLSVVPSPGLGLSLDPNEHQMAIKWWLELNTSPPCAFCPEHPLDPLGHHAVTCKRGGDAISRHNKLRDVVLQTCHRACISAKAEAAGRTAGSAAVAAELRKHSAKDAKCSELGWTCIPLVAESYGAWGSEAVQTFSRLALYLATRTNSPKSKVVCSLY
ncbi:hypothetical protein EMCRGX_G012400 [Ephydatia muelleri]